jgi:hypothetical protein
LPVAAYDSIGGLSIRPPDQVKERAAIVLGKAVLATGRVDG